MRYFLALEQSIQSVHFNSQFLTHRVPQGATSFYAQYSWSYQLHHEPKDFKIQTEGNFNRWWLTNQFMEIAFFIPVVVRRPKLCSVLILHYFSGKLHNIWGSLNWEIFNDRYDWRSCFILFLADKTACSNFCLLNFNWTYINYLQGWLKLSF